MSDLEMFKKVLISGGVPYTEEEVIHYKSITPEPRYAINCDNKDDFGYGGFTSTWLFDVDGKLITVGHFE